MAEGGEAALPSYWAARPLAVGRGQSRLLSFQRAEEGPAWRAAARRNSQGPGHQTNPSCSHLGTARSSRNAAASHGLHFPSERKTLHETAMAAAAHWASALPDQPQHSQLPTLLSYPATCFRPDSLMVCHLSCTAGTHTLGEE